MTHTPEILIWREHVLERHFFPFPGLEKREKCALVCRSENRVFCRVDRSCSFLERKEKMHLTNTVLRRIKRYPVTRDVIKVNFFWKFLRFFDWENFRSGSLQKWRSTTTQSTPCAKFSRETREWDNVFNAQRANMISGRSQDTAYDRYVLVFIFLRVQSKLQLRDSSIFGFSTKCLLITAI